jgi:hypothetical protein
LLCSNRNLHKQNTHRLKRIARTLTKHCKISAAIEQIATVLLAPNVHNPLSLPILEIPLLCGVCEVFCLCILVVFGIIEKGHWKNENT